MKITVFVGLLTLVFTLLKVMGAITWSWVWVLSPLWIEAFLLIVFTVWIAEIL